MSMTVHIFWLQLTKSNPFISGDSSDGQQMQRMNDFCEKLDRVCQTQCMNEFYKKDV